MSYDFFKGLGPLDKAKALRSRRAKWGKIGAGHCQELEDLIVELYALIEAGEGGLNKEEATKLRRQLAAANARASKTRLSDQDNDTLRQED